MAITFPIFAAGAVALACAGGVASGGYPAVGLDPAGGTDSGEKGSTSPCDVTNLTRASDRTPRVLESADEVRRAAAGEVTPGETSPVVDCPIIP